MKSTLFTKMVPQKVTVTKNISLPDTVSLTMTMEEARILATVIGQISHQADNNSTMSDKRYDVFSKNPSEFTMRDVSDALCRLYNPLATSLAEAVCLVEKSKTS
jgi:hypothetical protein